MMHPASRPTRRGGTGIVHLALVMLLGLSTGAPAGQAPLPAPRPLQASATPPRDPGPLTTTGTSRVRGRVVRAGTTEPIQRALVTIRDDHGGERRVTTDGDGRYEFRALPGGRFSLDAAQPGYLTLEYGQRRPFEPGRPLSIRAGETLTGVDFALPRGGVIAGRVTDERGRPIVGADVQVSRYQYAANGERTLSRTTALGPRVTNDLGEFRAFGLMPGGYVVSAIVRQMPLPPGQTTSMAPAIAFLPTYYPGTASEGEAQPVEVALEQTVSVQFAMAKGRLTRASGVVVDSSGRPAAGAALSLATTVGGASSAKGVGTVAADGGFTIPGIPSGQHYIQVRLEPLADGSRASEAANVPFAAGTEDVSGLRLTTSSGATLAGRVEWNGSAPRARGSGAARLRIVASPREQRPLIFGFAGINDPGSGTVGADDAFRIAGVLEPVLLGVVGLPPQWMLQSVIVDGADVTATGVDPATLGSNSSVRVLLTDRVTELTGRVTSPGKEPATEYVVVVLPAEPVPTAVAARFIRLARPDQGGVYRTGGLPPGRYVAVAVRALEDGTQWDPVFQATVRPAASRFTLSEGQSLTLDLTLLE